ncbi:MAG: hypothetical protein KDD47_28120 [Acidobacteria bacterium]|nr:hypothetical protein [Acidobacteriota bacterium]
MNSFRKICLILALGFAGSFALGMLRGGTTVATYRWGPDAIGSENLEAPARRLVAAAWQPRGILGAEVIGPGTASRLEAGPADTLLVMDFHSREIRQLDPQQDEARVRVRAARGILDFGADADGIWWIEEGAPVLRRQDSRGEALEPIPLAQAPHRAASLPNGGLVALNLEPRPELFQLYGRDGGPGRPLGRLLAGEVQEPLVLEGSLAASPDGGFVYVPYYLPFLTAYEGNGALRYRRALAGSEAGPPPSVVRGAQGSRNVQPGTRVQAFSVHVTGDRLAVLAQPRGDRKGHRVLDFYDLGDGAYLESLRLPEGARDALWRDGTLYTLHRDGIRRWQAGPSTPIEGAVG